MAPENPKPPVNPPKIETPNGGNPQPVPPVTPADLSWRDGYRRDESGKPIIPSDGRKPWEMEED